MKSLVLLLVAALAAFLFFSERAARDLRAKAEAAQAKTARLVEAYDVLTNEMARKCYTSWQLGYVQGEIDWNAKLGAVLDALHEYGSNAFNHDSLLGYPMPANLAATNVLREVLKHPGPL